MRTLRGAEHLHEFGPESGAPASGMDSAYSASFPHVAKQAFPDSRVGGHIRLGAVPHHAVLLPDLVLFEIIQIVAEDGLIRARGFAHELERIVGIRDRRVSH